MSEYRDKDKTNEKVTGSTGVAQRKQRGTVRGVAFEDNRTETAQLRGVLPQCPSNVAGRPVLQAKDCNAGRQLKPQEPVQKKENRTGLPDNLKAGVENLSGLAMDDVRVSYNSDKPAQLNAHAYTQGTEIHVAPGQEKHLPHEAWHVVQQKEGRVRPTEQTMEGVKVNDDERLEREADMMGAKGARTGDSRKATNSGSICHRFVQETQNMGGTVLDPTEKRTIILRNTSSVRQYAVPTGRRRILNLDDKEQPNLAQGVRINRNPSAELTVAHNRHRPGNFNQHTIAHMDRQGGVDEDFWGRQHVTTANAGRVLRENANIDHMVPWSTMRQIMINWNDSYRGAYGNQTVAANFYTTADGRAYYNDVTNLQWLTAGENRRVGDDDHADPIENLVPPQFVQLMLQLALSVEALQHTLGALGPNLYEVGNYRDDIFRSIENLRTQVADTHTYILGR